MNEGPYRHPGGRTCAGAVAMLSAIIAAGTGFWFGAAWAALHLIP